MKLIRFCEKGSPPGVAICINPLVHINENDVVELSI